jgi:hypothetical protein
MLPLLPGIFWKAFALADEFPALDPLTKRRALYVLFGQSLIRPPCQGDSPVNSNRKWSRHVLDSTGGAEIGVRASAGNEVAAAAAGNEGAAAAAKEPGEDPSSIGANDRPSIRAGF